MSNITASEARLLNAAYAAFNARDIRAALATMSQDVSWPKAFKGGFAHGHEASATIGRSNGRRSIRARSRFRSAARRTGEFWWTSTWSCATRAAPSSSISTWGIGSRWRMACFKEWKCARCRRPGAYPRGERGLIGSKLELDKRKVKYAKVAW